MAPVASKPPRPYQIEPIDVTYMIVEAFSDRLIEMCDGLVDLVEYVQDCLEEVGELTVGVAESIVNDVCNLGSTLCCLNSGCKRSLFGGERLISGLPVLFVLQILGNLYAGFVFGYMPAAGIAFNSPISLWFHALTFMVLASFFQASSVQPGTVPKSAKWYDQDNPPPCLTECKKNEQGAFRWCRKSNCYKPDRAHYDRQSQQVVLRMDHHCPWLANTIGHRNHKHFMLLLLYTNISCLVVDASILQLLLTTSLPSTTVVFLLETLGISCVLSTIFVPFFMFHTWLLSRNMTTLEFIEDREQLFEHEDRWIYDVGLYQNFVSIFGENPLFWLVPAGSPSCDGIKFPRVGHAIKDCSSYSDSEEDGTLCDKTDESLENGRSDSLKAEEDSWTCASEFADDFLMGCVLLGEAAADSAQRLVSMTLGWPSSDQPDKKRKSKKQNSPRSGSSLSQESTDDSRQSLNVESSYEDSAEDGNRMQQHPDDDDQSWCSSAYVENSSIAVFSKENIIGSGISLEKNPWPDRTSKSPSICSTAAPSSICSTAAPICSSLPRSSTGLILGRSASSEFVFF